jgi:hypothetical protein
MTSLAGLGLRWGPDIVAAAVNDVIERAGRHGTEWQGMAEVVLRDAFTATDAVDVFLRSSPSEQTVFLRSLPHEVLQWPRRWPVDIGLGQVPVRRLDEAATRKVLAEALGWLQEHCYFGRELEIRCVDANPDSRELGEVIAGRLNLPPVGSVYDLLTGVGVGQLADVVAVAREYIALPPERYFHTFASCGLHPGTGAWSAELGRRILDDVVATIAANSDLGALLLAPRQIGAAVAAPAPADPLRRTSPAVYAPAEAFLPHGSVLTVTRLVTRLAAARQLTALEAFLRAHRVHVESAGQTTMPAFILVIEIFADDQARLQRHEATITQMLGELTALNWAVRYTLPPEYRRPAELSTLDRAAIATRLERAGRSQEAGTALRSSFRFRPRPGTAGGVQMVSVLDDPESEDAALLELTFRTSRG